MSEPNRAPLNAEPEMRDEATAAQQLSGDRPMQDGAAGGGLGGLSAAETAADADAPEEAATPNNPASPAVAGDAASLRAEGEAQHLSDTAEPKPLPGGNGG